MKLQEGRKQEVLNSAGVRGGSQQETRGAELCRRRGGGKPGRDLSPSAGVMGTVFMERQRRFSAIRWWKALEDGLSSVGRGGLQTRRDGYEESRKGHLLRKRHVGYFPLCCFLAEIFLQISESVKWLHYFSSTNLLEIMFY